MPDSSFCFQVCDRLSLRECWPTRDARLRRCVGVAQAGRRWGVRAAEAAEAGEKREEREEKEMIALFFLQNWPGVARAETGTRLLSARMHVRVHTNIRTRKHARALR